MSYHEVNWSHAGCINSEKLCFVTKVGSEMKKESRLPVAHSLTLTNSSQIAMAFLAITLLVLNLAYSTFSLHKIAFSEVQGASARSVLY